MYGKVVSGAMIYIVIMAIIFFDNLSEIKRENILYDKAEPSSRIGETNAKYHINKYVRLQL